MVIKIHHDHRYPRRCHLVSKHQLKSWWTHDMDVLSVLLSLYEGIPSVTSQRLDFFVADDLRCEYIMWTNIEAHIFHYRFILALVSFVTCTSWIFHLSFRLMVWSCFITCSPQPMAVQWYFPPYWRATLISGCLYNMLWHFQVINHNLTRAAILIILLLLKLTYIPQAVPYLNVVSRQTLDIYCH